MIMIAESGFNSHPRHVVVSSNKALGNDFLCLEVYEQAANLLRKEVRINPKFNKMVTRKWERII